MLDHPLHGVLAFLYGVEEPVQGLAVIFGAGAPCHYDTTAVDHVLEEHDPERLALFRANDVLSDQHKPGMSDLHLLVAAELVDVFHQLLNRLVLIGPEGADPVGTDPRTPSVENRRSGYDWCLVAVHLDNVEGDDDLIPGRH